MPIGALELNGPGEEHYEALERYVDALRQYWLAHTSLARAVGNALPAGGSDALTFGIHTLLRAAPAAGHGDDNARRDSDREHRGHRDRDDSGHGNDGHRRQQVHDGAQP